MYLFHIYTGRPVKPTRKNGNIYNVSKSYEVVAYDIISAIQKAEEKFVRGELIQTINRRQAVILAEE